MTGRECKPDYEKLIAEKKERLRVNLDLHDALLKYIEGMQSSSALVKPTTLVEILGILTLGKMRLNKAIQELIKQQEKAEKEKD